MLGNGIDKLIRVYRGKLGFNTGVEERSKISNMQAKH